MGTIPMKKGFDMRWISSRWLAPSIHFLFFCWTLLIAVNHQSQPLFDGPAGFGVNVLFFSDLPMSVIAFSLTWDKHFVAGILLWGIGGTILWYLWGLLIRRIFSKRVEEGRSRQ